MKSELLSSCINNNNAKRRKLPMKSSISSFSKKLLEEAQKNAFGAGAPSVCLGLEIPGCIANADILVADMLF
jgi:hypothetical protein